MEIPVTGFIYHSGEDFSESHTHSLFLTSWDGKPVHTHPFRGVTTFDAGHKHKYVGETALAPSGVQHTHHYCAITSFDDGHRHEIKGTTGPAIYLQGGAHIHEFKGVTTVDGEPPHRHGYQGETGR